MFLIWRGCYKTSIPGRSLKGINRQKGVLKKYIILTRCTSIYNLETEKFSAVILHLYIRRAYKTKKIVTYILIEKKEGKSGRRTIPNWPTFWYYIEINSPIPIGGFFIWFAYLYMWWCVQYTDNMRSKKVQCNRSSWQGPWQVTWPFRWPSSAPCPFHPLLYVPARGSLLANFRGETEYATSAARRSFKQVTACRVFFPFFRDVTNLNRVKRAIRLLQCALHAVGIIISYMYIYNIIMYVPAVCAHAAPMNGREKKLGIMYWNPWGLFFGRPMVSQSFPFVTVDTKNLRLISWNTRLTVF